VAAVIWAQRTDVGPSERCEVGTDDQGRVLGYVQEFRDGSACYWFEPMQQAAPARSLDEAKRKVLDASKLSP